VGGKIGSFGFLELALSGGKKPNVPMCVGKIIFFCALAKNLKLSCRYCVKLLRNYPFVLS